jgi:hydroxypyruvate reductase
VQGAIEGVECIEAGHPVPDENSFRGAERILELTKDLRETDTVLFLLSGGGSALFEKPLIEGEELQAITNRLLACGADIVKINTIRKRLSAVKGGKFAAWCAPARIEAVVLSDILGDPLDMIASGPAAADSSTCAQALAIAEECGLELSERALECLRTETPKALSNVRTQIIGSVRQLCAAAEVQCRALGYETVFLTDLLSCEAREAGRFLAAILRSHAGSGKKLAFLAGGETVVHLTGRGKGGRNQEIALGAAELLSGLPACVISIGSDGTDGPTDAAGGCCDGDTLSELEGNGIRLSEVLKDNDAYHALKAINGLIFTGPTGTNVNDVTVGLLSAEV